MFNLEVTLLDLDSIVVPNRQRKANRPPGAIEALAADIMANNIIHLPIVESPSHHLVVGEGRLQAFHYLRDTRAVCPFPEYNGWRSIPVRLTDHTLSPFEVQSIELMENLRRTDLAWTDECEAILTLHTMLVEKHGKWPLHKTAEILNLHPSYVQKRVSVGHALREDDKIVREASSVQSAYSVLQRRANRAKDLEIGNLTDSLRSALPQALIVETDSAPAQAEPTPPPMSQAEILHTDFHAFLEQPIPQPFNFIHCDFPYGINWGSANKQNSRPEYALIYEDSPDVYWHLLEALADNMERLVSPSAHLIFWFSMNHYDKTKELLTAMGWHLDPFPIIWHKSDNKGILPDPQRGGRRTYETAFFGRRGDRAVASPVALSYAAQTGNRIHPSEKPEPMLRHFFRLTVDATTRMLDPTCGSGSALRAAKSLGAQRALGVEKDAEHVAAARRALEQSGQPAG